MTEIWLQSPNFPKYEVSDQGRVRNKKTGKIKKSVLHGRKNRYPYVWLSNAWSSNTWKSIASLVLVAFHPGPLEGKYRRRLFIRYKDKNSLNCGYDNLYLAPRSEAVKESWQEGKYDNRVVTTPFLKGVLNPRSRLYTGEKS